MKQLNFQNLLMAALFFVSSLTVRAQNPSSITGTITFADETLAGLTEQHGANLLKSGVVFEIWSVAYRDVMVKTNTGQVVANTRVYLTQKQTGASVVSSIGTSGSSKSINFTVNNIPSQGNYVVLYYFNGYPAKFKLFKPTSKLNDGSNRANVQYAVNAPTKIGNDKKYGVLSINNLKLTQEYSVSLLANTTGAVAFGLWGDIVDFFSDLAEVVWEGGKTLAGVVVDAAGAIIVQAYGGIQLLITDGTYPKYREITDGEYAWANSKIFNNTLPAKNRIIITNLRGVGNREFVWPAGALVGGKILMNLGVVGYNDPMTMHLDKGKQRGQVFMHELTHVWQIHTRSDIAFAVNAIKDQCVEDQQSLYTFTCGSIWGNYKIEQQAKAVENCYVARESSRVVCEEPYIVANIRNGVAFPILRSAECIKLLQDINSANTQITNRTNQLKSDYLEQHGESTIRNDDGSFKVGTEKGLANAKVPASVLNNDAQLKSLKEQLAMLNQKKAAINCQ
jgi:hypothetical protein